MPQDICMIFSCLHLYVIKYSCEISHLCSGEYDISLFRGQVQIIYRIAFKLYTLICNDVFYQG
jgi:hypothetical protein